MDWFSFIAGALAGWIIEWLIDLFYWRRRQSRWADTEARLQSDLAGSQNMVNGLRSREMEISQQLSIARGDLSAANSNLSVIQGELDDARSQVEVLTRQLALAESGKQALADHLNGELAASEAEVTTLREQLERALADNVALQNENTALRERGDELESTAATRLGAIGLAAAGAAGAAAGAAATRGEEVRGDDLTIIEGIGPKIAELLNQNGITTFSELANTSVDDLERILRSGGNRFQTANPETWPRQARLAANRDWTRLDALKAQLLGGVRRPSTAAERSGEEVRTEEVRSDDLTIIEGIGPKIAELLNQNGITTFSKLADTSVDDLERILRSGGNRFQTANPETWPRQARLAANRDWTRLDALKAQLLGGVRRPGGEGPDMRSGAAPAAAPEPQDDLTVIEGIGPKIAELLNSQGIRTFAQLARMEPARLRLILNEAGPAYRIADPGTWPEQASWAAVGNWDRLQALKDQLNAGRRSE